MPPDEDETTPTSASSEPAEPPELEAPAPTDPLPETPRDVEPAGLHIEPGTPEAEFILGALRTSETWTLDALANCAGAPWGSTRRSAPNYEQADKVRAQLDMIDRMHAALGHTGRSSRRDDVEKYFAEQAAIWERQAAQAPA